MKSQQLEDKLSDKEAYAKILRKIRIYLCLSLFGMFFCMVYSKLLEFEIKSLYFSIKKNIRF